LEFKSIIDSDDDRSSNQVTEGRFSSLLERLGGDRDFTLFLAVGVFSGIASGINSTVFNNFLSDVYKLSAEARGIVEFPRELPGSLIMVVIGMLSFLGDIRMAAVGMLAASVGMVGLGMFSPTFATMLMCFCRPGSDNFSRKHYDKDYCGQYNRYKG